MHVTSVVVCIWNDLIITHYATSNTCFLLLDIFTWLSKAPQLRTFISFHLFFFFISLKYNYFLDINIKKCIQSTSKIANLNIVVGNKFMNPLNSLSLESPSPRKNEWHSLQSNDCRGTTEQRERTRTQMKKEKILQWWIGMRKVEDQEKKKTDWTDERRSSWLTDEASRSHRSLVYIHQSSHS